MDATCTIQDSIHVFNLVHKYVSRILGTYHFRPGNTFTKHIPILYVFLQASYQFRLHLKQSEAASIR